MNPDPDKVLGGELKYRMKTTQHKEWAEGRQLAAGKESFNCQTQEELTTVSHQPAFSCSFSLRKTLGWKIVL